MVGQPEQQDAQLWERYERAFRSLLWRLRTRRMSSGVEKLQREAQDLIDKGVSSSDALQLVYAKRRAEVIQRLVEAIVVHRRSAGASSLVVDRRRHLRVQAMVEAGIPARPVEPSPDFYCDAAVGGLARWLRAAGYDAVWWQVVDDNDLLRMVAASSAIMLTTDGRLAARGVVTKGVVPALLVPNGPTKTKQLAFVMSQLDLRVTPARCMSCGGRLQRVAKTTVRNRIPPRTYPWRDDYYLCERCDKLFWQGTHWERIARELAHASGRATGPQDV